MKVESTGGPAPAAAVYQEDTSHRAQVAPGPARGSTPAWWRHFTTFQQLLRQRMAEDRLSQQAAALTYNTLFSLLPTLVLALIVMSMVLSTGQVQREEIVLLHKLGLGQLRNRQGGAGSAGLFLQTVTAQIQKMRTVLQSPGTGLVGFAVLLWGALSLMNVVEATFNRVYRVTRRRTWVRRLPLYWCVLTLGPLGVASSLVFSGKLLATIGHRAGPILAPLTFLLALGIDWILLLLFYRLIPNAYVRWRSAALGAAAATLLWEAGKYGFGLYVHYLAGYGKWYGNLGLIPLFMFWVFLTWMFVLLGLQIAFIDQHYMALQRRHLSPHGLGAGWIDIRWVLPLAVLLVLRPVPRRFRHRLTALLVVTLAATVVYSPWMLRSMVATHTRTSLGNPIFPLFAGTLGRDHWSKALAKRFDRGHRPPANEASLEGHLGALANQFFLDRQWSPGVAAYIDALANPPGFPSPNLPWPWRLGLLWLVCLPALAWAITSRPASLLLAVLAVQLLAWLSCTQLQARFLLPAIIPMAWLLGLAADRYGGLGRISLLVLLAQAGFCALLLRPEAGLFLGPIRGAAIAPIGRRFHWPRDWLVGRHPVVRFPTHATYYLEGLATPLYLRGRVIYNTVFNRNRLGRVLARGGPAAAVRWLEKRGVNFLILDWPEVRRLRATYGFNSAVTPAAIAAMQRAGLQPLKAPTIPGIQIFRVSGRPQRNSGKPPTSHRPRDDPAPRAVWPPTAPTDR